MKISDKQKKALLIAGVVALAVWVFMHKTRNRNAVPDAPADNGSAQAGYATYNMPQIFGPGGTGGGSSYSFGDINIGGTSVTSPSAGMPTLSFDMDALASKICACNNGCPMPGGSEGSYLFANFEVPNGQAANYTAPLVPYVSGFFPVH